MYRSTLGTTTPVEPRSMRTTCKRACVLPSRLGSAESDLAPDCAGVVGELVGELAGVVPPHALTTVSAITAGSIAIRLIPVSLLPDGGPVASAGRGPSQWSRCGLGVWEPSYPAAPSPDNGHRRLWPGYDADIRQTCA